ncbi:MAG: ABC transporter transmembrane domain-containing protein, partial [Bacteroidota bacterium]
MHSNNAIPPIKRFWKLLAQDQKDVTNIYVYALFNGLVGLSLPLGIQAIINLLQGGSVNSSWLLLVVVVVLGVAFTGTLQIFQMRITENIQQKIFTRTSLEFTQRILRIKEKAMSDKHPPELMNRLFDTLTLQKGLSKILIEFSTSSLQVIFGLLLLAFYHPFFILFGVSLVVIVTLLLVYTSKAALRASIKESTF